MENLAHSLVGVALSRAGLGRKTPYGATSLVVAANLPDLDIVVSWWGPLHYLHHHRGVTHSVLGVLVLALAFSLLLKFLARFRSGDKTFPFGPLLLSVTLTLVSHSLLDWTNSYGIRPWLPFSGKWYYGDLVFIVDPYLWLILGGAVFLTARRTRVTRPVWIAVVAFICFLLLKNAEVRPDGAVVAVVCLSAMALILILKRQRAVWSGSLNVWALAGVAAYWVLLLASRTLTLAAAAPAIARAYPQVRAEELNALPRLANPLSWEVLWQDRKRIHAWRASVSGGEPGRSQVLERHLDHDAVRAALATCPGRVMVGFGRLTFYDVIPEPDRILVLARDARFARLQTSGFGVVPIPLSRDLSRSLSPLACPCQD